ncbi:MAG: (Fe-S)-binding protein [Planctomycetota bacterium]|nr:(Fe-S)-binding protein [Planctomycetota bacterium]
MYYVGCLPYFEPIFTETGAHPLAMARNTLKILNALGIKPSVYEGEVCCGHDLYWTGNIEGFKKLAALNLENIQKTGVKRIIFSCPECFYTYKILYPQFFKTVEVETVHMMQLLDEKIKKGELKLGRLEGKFTFQDPCRLGRLLAIYDEPRRVLKSVKGLDLQCMEEIRKESICCGSTHWVSCSSYTKQLQKYRLGQAVDTGASTLLTACPKCQIHLSCAAKDLKTKMKIQDYTEIIVQAMEQA